MWELGVETEMGSKFTLLFGVVFGKGYVSVAFDTEEIREQGTRTITAICDWVELYAEELKDIGIYVEGGEQYCSTERIEKMASNHPSELIRDLSRKELIKKAKTDLARERYQSNQKKLKDEREPSNGWIYVVGSREQQLYKIGFTTRTPNERLLEFAPKLPFPTTLICAIKSHDVITDEMVFHDAFDDKRTNGEWFELDNDDLDWLKAHARTSGGTVCE